MKGHIMGVLLMVQGHLIGKLNKYKFVGPKAVNLNLLAPSIHF